MMCNNLIISTWFIVNTMLTMWLFLSCRGGKIVTYISIMRVLAKMQMFMTSWKKISTYQCKTVNAKMKNKVWYFKFQRNIEKHTSEIWQNKKSDIKIISPPTFFHICCLRERKKGNYFQVKNFKIDIDGLDRKIKIGRIMRL